MKKDKTAVLNSDTEYAKVSPIKRIVRTKAFPLFVLLLVLIITFSILAPLRTNFQGFLRVKSIWRVIQDIAVTGFLTIGIGLLIVSGNIDLSASTVGSMAGVLCAVTMGWYNWNPIVSVIFALLVAAVVGLINGVLVNELQQPPFIATMAMSTILLAVCQIVATDRTGQIIGMVSFNNKTYEKIAATKLIGDINVVSVILIVAFIVYGLALAKTKFGRTLYLMGANRTATHLAGINAKAITYFVFINCSVLGAVSGIINSSRTKAGSSMALSASQFAGMTAAILGGISFGGGSGGLGGAFLGLLVINTFSYGMTTSGATPYLTPVLSGGLLLAALAFDYFSTKAQNKRVGA